MQNNSIMQTPPLHNHWEQAAFEEHPYDKSSMQSDAVSPKLFHSTLYCPSGIDIMSILGSLVNRQNPLIDTQDISLDWPMILCDLTRDDQPIVYCSPGFTTLTGYTSQETIGQNCRFLQAPGGRVRPRSTRAHVSKETLRTISDAVETNSELEIQLVNFRKDGTGFVNHLIVIPIRYRSWDYNFSIGFQREAEPH